MKRRILVGIEYQAHELMKRLAEAVRTCKACPLGPQGRGVPGTWVNGQYSALGVTLGDEPKLLQGGSLVYTNEEEVVMILGEAPGAVEMAQGKPFVGRSGELLRSMLEEVGLTSYYLSNIARHQPYKDRQGKQQAPSKTEIEACAPFLRAEFSLIRPSKLLLLGKTAAKLVVDGNFSMKDVVNTTVTYQIEQTHYNEPGIPALLLYHPSYFLRQRTAPWIQKSIREWKQSLKLFLGDKPPKYKITEVHCEIHN